MKRGILIIFLLLIPIVQAIGATPSSANLNFKPNLQTQLSFTFFPTNANINTKISLSGDLSRYATLNKNQLIGEDTVTIEISLPKVLESGTHYINLHGTEDISKEGIAASSGVTIPIRIFVPYEGKYIEASLEVQNTNVNEDGRITIKVKNIGTEPILQLYSIISILSNENEVKKLQTQQISLNSEESKTIETKFSTSDLTQGEYKAIATVFYDNLQEILEKEFLIGDLIVNILNFTNTAKAYEINKFFITIESKWNNPINEIFANISLTKNNNEILTTKTPTSSLQPRETKNLETFLDLTEISPREYDIAITLNYANKQTITKGKLNVLKSFSLSQNNIILMFIIIIILSSILWYYKIKQKTKRIKNAKST